MELIERKVSLMMSHLPDQELLRDPAFHQVARLTVLRAIMNSKRTKPAELKRAKEFFQIDANLTYLGSQNVSVNYVNPFLAGISVQSLVNSSRYVWGFQPSSAVYFSNTMSYGMSFSREHRYSYKHIRVYHRSGILDKFLAEHLVHAN